MRTFAALILLLNVGYFSWNQIRGKDVVVDVSPGQSSFVPAEQSLILLSELPSITSSSNEQEEAVADFVQQVPALDDQDVEENAAPSVVTPDQNEIPQAWCGLVSGFEDRNEATAFIVDVVDMGIAGELDVQQEQISSTWWVHLPPFKTQAEAQIVIDELVAKGIDNFYMRTGELAGGISLGVFSRESSATTAQTELLRRGYKANIKEIPRYVSKAYVAIGAPDATRLETIEWKAFLATKTKLEVTEKLCETIAR